MTTEQVVELYEKELQALQEASEMCKNNPQLVQYLPELALAMNKIADILL